MVATAFVVVAALSMVSVNTGFAGNLERSLPFFAQKSNGQGQNDNNPPTSPGTGNNGQGQGQENGNPPADPGNGNNSQGQGNGNPPENPGDGNNGQGNGNQPVSSDETGSESEDDAAEDAGAAEDNGTAKVNVCHVTDKDSGGTVMITISEQAVPAHEGHGDTLIDVASEDECLQADAPVAPEVPAATPVPDDGEDEDEDDDDAVPPVDIATPGATPIATPIASPDIG